MNYPVAQRNCEQRAAHRIPVALPILILLGKTRYGALLCNLTKIGAMFESTAPLTVDMTVVLQCGTICTGGLVMWQRGGTYGIKFSQGICDRQLADQISRLEAVAKRRELRGSPGISTTAHSYPNNSPCA